MRHHTAGLNRQRSDLVGRAERPVLDQRQRVAGAPDRRRIRQ